MVLQRLIAGLFVSGALSATAVTTLYVSPQGDDTNPGTRQKPFASVFRARDEIRTQKGAGKLPADGVVVEMAGGRYDISETFELTAEDSGAPGAPVIYRCDREDRAWLVAGRDVPVSALQPLTDADVLARIPRDARSHVRCLDLKRAGIRYYTRLPDRFNCWAFSRRYPEELGYKPEYGYEPGRWTPMEVFCDGRELTPARWPNRDYIRIDEVIDDGEGFCSANTRPGTFAQPSLKDKLKLWAGAEELILNGYFFRDYFCYSVRVGKLDLATSSITLSHGLLDKKHKPHQRFYVHHLPEELDIPGEWVLNRATGLLCLWPPKGARTLTFPVLTDTIVRLNGASHVTIHGLGVEGGRHHAIEVTGGESNRIIACDIRNVGRDGVLVKDGRDHRVLGCDIHHTGHAGVRLDGGDRRTLTPAGHIAENNHIHHTSRLVRNYSAPLYLRGVGNRASRNLIHDIPHIAVCFMGNEHVMELNEMFSVLYETNEAGIFYTGRDWTARGNIIRYNFMHHVTGVPDWGVNFVHLDDSASATEIHGNVCYKLERGVSICGGHENKVHDNLFVQCLNTVSLASRGIDMFENDGKGGFVYDDEAKGWNSLTKRLIQYKWNQPPYSTRYPKLVEIFTKNPIAAPWWNEIQRNIAVDCDQHVRVPAQAEAWECVVKDNWSGGDPGFVEPDHARLDFRLKPDAEACTAIGFQPIPLDRIGVYASPDRATWPVECLRPPSDWKPRWLLRKEAMSKTPIRVFPVADIKTGRRIVIDGAVRDEEWSPPGYDGSEPNRHGAATIEWLLNGDREPKPSTAYIETDGSALFVAFINEVEPSQALSPSHRWGADDAVEVALAVNGPPETAPGKERPFIFRGYPDGHVEGSTESGWMEQEVARAMQGVQFAAKTVDARTWTAEFRIPFASFGLLNPANENRPILVNLTVHKAAGKSWVQWKRQKGYSWEVHGGQALWLKPFGALPYLPGCRPAHARIDIQMMPGTTEKSLEAGAGVDVADWAKDGNRLTANFGSVRGNRWTECRFQFTSRVDADAELQLMGTMDAWTYYDDFRVDGAEFTNPDFELSAADGAFPGWSFKPDRNSTDSGRSGAGIVCPPDGAAAGLRSARASHDRRVVKALKLKQGREVTVTFQARAALPLTAE